MGEKSGYLEHFAQDAFNKKSTSGLGGITMTSSVRVGTGSNYNSAKVKDNPIILVLVFIIARNAINW